MSRRRTIPYKIARLAESCTEYPFQSAQRVASVDSMLFILLRYDRQPDP